MLSAVKGFAQSKNSKEVTTKLSGDRNNSQNVVVDTLKTPSLNAKHQVTGAKNAPSSNLDNDPATIPTGANKVTGKKE